MNNVDRFAPHFSNKSSGKRVGLVSMPWMSAHMPSIQLATIAATLRANGFACDIHELYVDYASAITIPLYDILSNDLGFIEEWLFAQYYFGPEHGNYLNHFLKHRPTIPGINSSVNEAAMLRMLVAATGDFLNRIANEEFWKSYDILGFSLTISQTGASLALARLLKLKYPDLRIIFGGTACAGSPGSALLRVSQYLDVVVRVEGEPVLPSIVERLRDNRSLAGIPGISYRDSSGVHVAPPGQLHHFHGRPPALDYDAYFKRIKALKIEDQLTVWLPFETSRGCWWGEKNQCTFCGLHEIMAYRERPPDVVLDQMEDLASRYELTRFFSCDLIMPHRYYLSFLPTIVRRKHNWTIFFEMKANIDRRQLELLASAGVVWIQPGMESLETSILQLMRKGVSALQNIQVLKWCTELGMTVTWNIITGLPGESPDAYVHMAHRIRKLFHLQPPQGRSPFILQRFSPYFDNPAEFGLTVKGPLKLYEDIFPIGPELSDFAYAFDYSLPDGQPNPIEYTKVIVDAVAEWRLACKRHPRLELKPTSEGALIYDSRQGDERTCTLDRAELALYRALDAVTTKTAAIEALKAEDPTAFRTLERRCGDVAYFIDAWINQNFVETDGDQILGLATQYQQARREIPSPLRSLVAAGTRKD